MTENRSIQIEPSLEIQAVAAELLHAIRLTAGVHFTLTQRDHALATLETCLMELRDRWKSEQAQRCRDVVAKLADALDEIGPWPR